MRILLLASKGDEANRIANFCRVAFDDVEAHHGDWNEPLPEVCSFWRGDLVVSYCSRWIVPGYLLDRASLASINFHPGPPEHPGVGGLNWALYNGETSFGVTCHHMVPKVDAGPIVSVRRFPVFRSDTVATLFARTHANLETLAYDTLGAIANGESIQRSNITWSGTTRTRRELNDLSEVRIDMPASEASRRIRATAFGPWKPSLRIGNHTFELKG